MFQIGNGYLYRTCRRAIFDKHVIAKIGIAGTDPRIQPADWTVLAHAAMDESDGYVSPRLLTKAEIMYTLERITAR